MDFLTDYWAYHSCYEIPRNYAIFSGLGLIGSVIHRKVHYLHGDIVMYPNVYIGLIGPQGSSKSTCCSFARDFFKEACPDLPVGPSRASPESICRTMADEKFTRAFTNHVGESIEVRPLAFYINEFKNFVGRSPFDMLTFLTDVYDVKAYDASTIARGLEFIINPAINILCCETPEWIIRNVKGDVISGGFGRRIIYVHETDEVEDRPLPLITDPARLAIDRCRDRLKSLRSTTGIYTWDVKGFRDYTNWYKENAKGRRAETNVMMKGYLRSKHVQLFKVMMLLDVCSDKPNLQFTTTLVEEALAYLNCIELNMAKLTQAAGRNELLAAQQRIIEFLDKGKTWIEEYTVKKMIQSELSPTETYSAMKHLEDTEQIIRKMVRFPGRGEKWGFTTPAVYEKLRVNGEMVIKKHSEENKQNEINNQTSQSVVRVQPSTQTPPHGSDPVQGG